MIRLGVDRGSEHGKCIGRMIMCFLRLQNNCHSDSNHLICDRSPNHDPSNPSMTHPGNQDACAKSAHDCI